MKKKFDIEDPNLKKNPFAKRVSDQEQIKENILQGIQPGEETPQSRRVVYAAAGAILIITGLFIGLSRVEYNLDLYSSSPIAEIEAKQFETYELNEMDLDALGAAAEQEDLSEVSVINIDQADIIDYLHQSDLSNYELESHF